MLRYPMAVNIMKPVFKQQICKSSTWKEVKIPVPWGHLSGKWWGPQNRRPILTTHGWQDNSGSFDTLIPLLPQTTSFLAIDFPGSGYSSHLPTGTFTHAIDLVIVLRRIVEYFGWSKVSLLGHSMGAGVNYVYTMLYPEDVDFLICLDLLKPVCEDKPVQDIGKNIDLFLKYDLLTETNKKPPSHSLPDMEQRLHNSFNSVDLDKCKYILKRNIKPSDEPEKYIFTTNQRLKIFGFVEISQEVFMQNAARLMCPIFYSKSNKGQYFEKVEYRTELLDAIRKYNKNVVELYVEGRHHVHLNNPEVLADALNNFLNKYDIGDKTHSGFKNETLV